MKYKVGKLMGKYQKLTLSGSIKRQNALGR